MASRRVQQAAIAVGSDGSVLINVSSLVPARLKAQLALALGIRQPLFVARPMLKKEAELLLARLDDAAAEAAARVLGAVPPRPMSPPKRARPKQR